MLSRRNRVNGLANAKGRSPPCSYHNAQLTIMFTRRCFETPRGDHTRRLALWSQPILQKRVTARVVRERSSRSSTLAFHTPAFNRSPRQILNSSSLPGGFALGGYSGLAVGSNKYFPIVFRSHPVRLLIARILSPACRANRRTRPSGWCSTPVSTYAVVSCGINTSGTPHCLPLVI